jgi:hypothetical protein
VTFSRVARENRARNCPFHYTTLTQARQALYNAKNDPPSASVPFYRQKRGLGLSLGWMDSELFTSLRTPRSSGQVRCAAPSSTQPWLTLKTELEDIVKIPADASLSLLDATLKRSLTFCASYHGALWQTPAHFHVLTLGTCRTLFTKSFTT